MSSTDFYHPKTVWMTQGATHLRCSSGAEIQIAAGGKFRDQKPICTTGAKQSTTLDPYGTYALTTTGVYEINPQRGSVCTVHVHTTAFIKIKGASETDAVRFPTSGIRVLKVGASSSVNKRFGPGIQIVGMTTHRAYILYIGGGSSQIGKNSILVGRATST